MANKVHLGKQQIDRRTFIGAASAGAFAILVPRSSNVHHSLTSNSSADPVRVSGRISGGGRGLSGVAISDGLTVVDSDSDGYFELFTTSNRSFVWASVPSGYSIPTQAHGTASFYRSIGAARGGEMSASFELEPLRESDENHAALLLADVQVQDEDEVRWFHEQTVPDVAALTADLGVEAIGLACGDIVYDRFDLYPGYEAGVQNMGIPFFQVLGNHDMDQSALTDALSTETYSLHFGPPYYSFNRGAVHYVVLDDVFWAVVGYSGYLTQEQLTWLEADLNRVEPGSTVVVSAHIPVLGSRHLRTAQSAPGPSISVTNREALYDLLAPFNAHILTGHTHENEHVFEAGTHEHVSAAVCGAWWTGPICGDGSPSGYSVYEFRGEDVSWRYKATGQPFEYQIRAYPRGSVPGAPNEIVANVWDWDPEWTVVWYEGGDRKGEMARRVGRDPQSVELYQGSELPARRTWVEPVPTGHLFFAPVTEGASGVHVEATDRFGRTYSAAVPS